MSAANPKRRVVSGERDDERFPSLFTECCAGGGCHREDDAVVSSGGPDFPPVPELINPSTAAGPPPPIETVETTGEMPNVLSNLSHEGVDANGFPLTNDKVGKDDDDDLSDEESVIDFSAEFRREVEAPTGETAEKNRRSETPAPRLDRPTPSPVDSTFDDLEDSASLLKAKSGIAAASRTTTAVTAYKDRPDSKVGVAFCRYKSKGKTTVISHVLPESIFFGHNCSSNLVGARVLAVNGTSVKNPKHAAELVHLAEREVRLSVELVSASAASVASATEIDLHLSRHERQKHQGQLARKKRQDEAEGKKDNNVANSTASWTDSNVVESAFPKNAKKKAKSNSEKKAKSSAEKKAKTSSEKNDDKINSEEQRAESDEDADTKSQRTVPTTQGASLSRAASDAASAAESTLQNRTSSRIPLLQSGTKKSKKSLKMKLIKEQPSSSGSQQKAQLPTIKEHKKQDGKYVRVESDEKESKEADTESNEQHVPMEDLKRDAEDDTPAEEEQEARHHDLAAPSSGAKKGKSKSKMSLKRAFSRKKSKNPKKEEPAESPSPLQDKEAEKAIDPNMSVDEILSDLNSRSSSGSKKSKNEDDWNSRSGDDGKKSKIEADDDEDDAKGGGARISDEVDAAPEDGRDGAVPDNDAKSEEEAEADLDEVVLSTLSVAAERATSFILESVVSNLSGGPGFDSVVTNKSFVEEAVFKFPSEGEASAKGEEEENEEEENEEEDGSYGGGREEKAAGGDAGEDGADRPVEAVLTAVDEAHSPKKKKKFLKMFKKKSRAKGTQQDMGHVVVDEDNVSTNENEAVKDRDDAVGKDEDITPEEDEPDLEDRGEVDSTTEGGDAEDCGIGDLNVTQENFFKRAVFRKKSKWSPTKAVAGSEDTIPLVADVVKDQREEGDGEAAEDRDDASGIDLNVTQESFFKRAFKKKRSLAKKRRGFEQVNDVEDKGDVRQEQVVISDEDDVAKDVIAKDDVAEDQDDVNREEVVSVPDEVEAVKHDALAEEEASIFDASSIIEDLLNITSTGDVEVRTPSKRHFFDCALSPISSPKSPSDKKPAGDIDLERNGSNNDGTASLSLTDESITLDNTVAATPPSRPGRDAALPPTPPTPKKVGDGFDVPTTLFGAERPPSPSDSIVGFAPCNGDEERGPAALAAPSRQSYECRLQRAQPSAGKKESVNVSMEVLERVPEPRAPPPVNRKLNFDADDFNDSLCKAQFRSRASVDVTTVYVDEGGFSFQDEGRVVDEVRSLARTKQHAFDIVKQSKISLGGRARKAQHGEDAHHASGGKQRLSARVGSLTKSLFPKSEARGGGHKMIEDEVVPEKNVDITAATADMTGEASMLL